MILVIEKTDEKYLDYIYHRNNICNSYWCFGKCVRRWVYAMRKIRRLSIYQEFKQYREIQFLFDKKWKSEENLSFFNQIKCRKYSRYNNLRDSSYDNYMIDGLCYNFYFGLDKIKHYRLKYIRAIKNKKRI